MIFADFTESGGTLNPRSLLISSMVIRAYRTQAYSTTHENRIFDALLNQLEEVWGESEETVILLGNFYCQGAEVDAAVLKKNSITIIDFKDYGGAIRFSENGRWLADEIEVKGGSRPNPFIQVRENKFALLNVLKQISFPLDNKPNLGHISGLVLFHKPITFNEHNLPPDINRWFHVVDFDHIVERLSQIASREINLSNQDLGCIVNALSIPEYLPVGSGVKAITFPKNQDNADAVEFPDALRSTISQVERFLGSSDQLLTITGMIGTGLEKLISIIASKTLDQRRTLSVLAPNRRIASRYGVEVDSIYNYIYSKNPKHKNDKLVYELCDTKDSEQQLYIVSDAHLVSDAKYETDESCYGSGQLLTDFLCFADLQESKRQIIFLGDSFQLTRGKTDGTALYSQRLQALTNLQVRVVPLDRILLENQDNLFVQNCLRLAKGISEGTFNQLSVITDGLKVVEAPVEQTLKHQLLQDLFLKEPRLTKFTAFSHAEANKINKWIRKRVFRRGDAITEGDIVQFHNSFLVEKEGVERPTYISNGSFAEVTEVSKNIEVLQQPLKGRDNPITIRFFCIRAKLLPGSKEISFLCIESFLYAEKPELDKDILIALQASAKSRFNKYWNSRNPDSAEESKALRDSELAKFLQNDPYLNAARLRFGYALTLNRAQGHQFESVVANMETGQGQTNESYFRWVYTLFSIAQDRIILSNLPSITPLHQTIWDASQAKLGSVNPSDLIVFDPESEAGTESISEFSIPEKSLRNLYLQISSALQSEEIAVSAYKHHSYQELYGFEDKGSKASCSLRFHYNGKYRITKIEIVESNPDQFADRVCNILTSDVRLETDIQRSIYGLIKQKLDSYDILIQSIEHHDFQEVYYLKSESGALRMQLFYDGHGFITRIIPIAYTNQLIVEKVRLALGM